MDFQILGPVQVVSESGPVSLGGSKPRTLLAALLVRRGLVVSTDQLVEALWADRPPPGAVAALRAYMSRLRSVLAGDVGGPTLRFQAPGYVLQVPPGRVDAEEFERLIALARSHAADGDHGAVVSVLDTALGLWRGEALADFADREFARFEAARLSQLRVLVTEERVDALLSVGRHGEVITQLRDSVQLYPTRERSAVQLMRALYAAGRQGEALQTYQDLRTRLIGELGVEPSQPARLVHQRILAQDPVLDTSITGCAGNLPSRAPSLLGRDQDVDAVSAALDAAPLVTLVGVGGVGKSRLGLEVATRLTDRFRDGVWQIELAPLQDAGALGHVVASILRVQQRAGCGIEETVTQYLRGRNALLLIDNCEHLLGSVAGLVEAIVRYCPRVVVLATSREALGVPGEQVWPVSVLAPGDAAELFAQRACAVRPDFGVDSGTSAAVDRICQVLDGLPLAIELAATRMRVMTPVELVDRLSADRLLAVSGNAGVGGPRRHHQSLAATIDWSYRLLCEPEQKLFARLSIFAGGGDLTAIHAVCGEPGAGENQTVDVVARLVDKSLVQPHMTARGTRYRVLETLRAFGRERVREHGEHDGLARRHALYYVELADRIGREVLGPGEAAWTLRTRDERDNFRTAWQWIRTSRDIESAARLVTALPLLADVFVAHEVTRWAEEVLELVAEEHPLYVGCLGVAARGAWARGDNDHVRRLAASARGRAPAPDSAYMNYPEDVVADVSLYTGDPDSALRHYEVACAHARRDAGPHRLMWTLYRLMQCHAGLGTVEPGLVAAQEYLEIAERINNPTFLSAGRFALGQLIKRSEPHRALALFDQAAALAAQAYNDWCYGTPKMEAAATRATHGDVPRAAQDTLELLDHWERLGSWNQQWLNLANVARLFDQLGAPDDAILVHHCLVAAAKPSGLDPRRLAQLLTGPDHDRFTDAAARGSALLPADAVSYARARLNELLSG